MPTAASDPAGFDQWRRRIGLITAPLVFLVLWVGPFEPPSHGAARLLPVLGLVVVLWVTEAIPLAATALLGPCLCVVLGIGGPKEVFRGFSDPIIFVFLGSFLIAEGMLEHGLNRRVAIRILGLRAVTCSPVRLLGAFGAITAFISMWISNTATTAMMYPIGLAIATEVAGMESRPGGRPIRVQELGFASALMLMAAFASSIGGIATPVGTPPNLIGLGVIRERLGIEIPFFQWMLLGVPIMLVMMVWLTVSLPKLNPLGSVSLSGAGEYVARELGNLGPLTAGQRNVIISFLVTVFLWIAPGVAAIVGGTQSASYRWWTAHFPESVSALLGALLLFVLPTDRGWSRATLDWRSAARIDWGTVLLFGGGLAMGDLMFSTGLATWMGEGIARTTGVGSELGLIALFTLVAVAVSETTSNAASATMVVPISIAVSQSAGVDPLGPALGACLGSSLGFMLPVSTPPNAIVYASGCIPLQRMIRAGIALDLVGAVVIILGVTFLKGFLR